MTVMEKKSTLARGDAMSRLEVALAAGLQTEAQISALSEALVVVAICNVTLELLVFTVMTASGE